MRIEARSPEAEKISKVFIDGVDATQITAWVDADAGEAGVFAHRLLPEGKVHCLDGFTHVAGDPLFPLLNRDIALPGDKPFPEGPFTLTGKIEITYRS